VFKEAKCLLGGKMKKVDQSKADFFEHDEKLEDVLRRLMRLIKHIEGERTVSPKVLVQTIKEFLAKETF
jgi:hypothetical protein